MKLTIIPLCVVAVWSAIFTPLSGSAQGTAFNYQGRLSNDGAPANGNYDFTFRIYDALADGAPVSAGLTNLAVSVTDGLFGISLDFGAGVFNGDPRWIELTVRTNGNGSFTTLIPRQPVQPTPYAILANSAKNFTGALGTTTAQPLELQVNNQRALRLEKNVGLAPNIIGGPINNGVGSDVYGAFIGSGMDNNLGGESFYSSIVGGQLNTIQTNADHSVIGGGYNNTISNLSAHAVIGGGNNNVILSGSTSTIGGGWGNRLQGGWATIAGGSANVAEGDGSTVAGGAGNQAKGSISTVGGGGGNVINGSEWATISGGNGNQMLNSGGAVIGGGYGNSITNAGFSVVSGGQQNRITLNGDGSTISGGLANVADANYSSIIGGEGNITEGIGGYPTVLGGRYNKASGVASLAAGYLASATNNGSFVWNGWNGTEATFGSLADGEFAVNAPGGVRFFTGTGSFSVNGIDLSSGGVPDSSVTTIKLADGAVTVPKLSISGTAGEGKVLSYSSGNLAWTDASAGSGGWSLNGNAATTPVNNFLGTTDNQPLEFRVNNQRGFRLEPGGSNSVNVIGGYVGNSLAAGVVGATVGGGGAGDYFGFVLTNRVEANFSTVSGGYGNTIQTDARVATIGGGESNSIQTNSGGATIGGGSYNTIQTNAELAVIGGGQLNLIQSGARNSAISGGQNNQIQTNSFDAAIGGGWQNTIETNAFRATISGGGNNKIQNNASSSVIGGGYQNLIQNYAAGSFIGGGDFNTIQGATATIGGGHINTIGIHGESATIGGGQNNTLYGLYTTIGGGYYNAIMGSEFNVMNSSTISGGRGNIIQTNASTATIGGGLQNTIQTNGQYGTIPGGHLNTATNYAFAAGHRAKAIHTGTFVWADSQNADFTSTANNQFAVRADGGAVIQGGGGFGNPQLHLSQTANDFTRLRLSNPSSTWDISAGTDGSMRFYSGGSDKMIVNAGGLTVNGTFVSSSDRSVKENFEEVSPEQILAKVVALPISQWNYKQDKSAKHIGPMAQDFHAAFNVGPDDKHIAVVDESGVALAAIQGLNQKLEEQTRRADEKESALHILQKQNQTLEQRLAELEQMVKSLAEKK